MSGCIGCSCTRADGLAPGGRVLLATGVSHSLTALRAAVHEVGATATEPQPGLLDVATGDPAALTAVARRRLSSVEADEVRALVVDDAAGGATLAAAMSAPTLAQVMARVENTDLLALFADELGAFRSVYQPIVDLGGDARVVGHEALLRATGPAGPVLPAELFGAAKQAGWLHMLDRVGRTSALRGAGGWLGDDLLFVNFLPTTIYRPQVCLATTERAAQLAGLRLDQLVFEVTESERVTDIDHLAEVFSYYRDRGCRVALDDLGAGYSSLNLLVRLQPDVVKLDKDIVQRLPDAASSAVVSAVVAITHAYGGKVLAECVETAEQAQAATDLGVDLGQGWFFGRPVERTAGPSAVTLRTPEVPSAARASGNDAAVAIAQPAQHAAAPVHRAV